MGRTFKKIVFVVGAGASKEFGLPTGRELLDNISTFVRQTHDGFSFVHEMTADDLDKAFRDKARKSDSSYDTNLYKSLKAQAYWISKVCRLAPSIDNLLHAHASNEHRKDAGKLLLAFGILSAEASSKLAASDGDDFKDFFFKYGKSPTNTWLGELFWLLVEQNVYEDFLSALSSITFISFNYDRCIKHFIANAAILYFDLDEARAREVFERLNVFHPYGHLGDLYFERGAFRGFGKSKESLVKIASGIRTFTEGLKTEEEGNAIESAFSDANAVCFMGFGYLGLNMELLFGKQGYSVPHIFGTCLGLSDESKASVRSTLANKLQHETKSPELKSAGFHRVDFRSDEEIVNVKLAPMTCAELLDRHRMFFRE